MLRQNYNFNFIILIPTFYTAVCIVDGTKHENGSSWTPDNDGACVQCSCKNGVSDCSKRSDCEKDTTAKCLYGDKVVDSGEKWVDGCLECECLVSRYDLCILTSKMV